MGLLRFLFESLFDHDDGDDPRENRAAEWERQQAEDDLEEEYDEIDGIEDADY